MSNASDQMNTILRRKAEALREYADEMKVDSLPDHDGDEWWAGYRQAQRDFTWKTIARAADIERGI